MWLFGEGTSGRPTGFLYDLFIEETRRGQGHGMRALSLPEREALKMGAQSLALHVVAHNAPALFLYRKLGYEVQSLNKSKIIARDLPQ